MEITIQLDSQHAAQLEYIQQHYRLDTAALIALTIEREYQQLQPTDESTVNPLSRSSFIGCFQGSPDLATNSKSMVFWSFSRSAYGKLLKVNFPPVTP